MKGVFMTNINQFNSEVISLINRGKKVSRVSSARLMNDVSEFGPLYAVKRLVARESGIGAVYAPAISEVVGKFYLTGNQHLLVENLVIDPRFSDLFTEEEVEFCRELLGAA